MGLCPGGGVHADMGHLEACLELAPREKVGDVVVHAFLDGRDTPPRSAKRYLATIQAAMDRIGVGRYGVISGRYYAMDRDTRWDRVKLAYDALVYAEGFFAADAQAAVDAAYARGENDEFVRPTIVAPEHDSRVRDGDVCLFFNFRPDRARELTRAFTERGFAEFDRGAHPPAADFVTMTQYKKEFPLPVAFPPDHPRHVLADVLAEHGLRQLHIAETEKYAHVTFFFNGGVEKEVEGEERVLVPSPRDVPTYDHKPEMSAVGVTDELVARIEADAFDFIVVNYANADMVGHTGVIPAAVKAVETVDALPRPGRRRRARLAAAPASSPPTTATRTTCWSRTAVPTPPTAPTWSRSWRRCRRCGCARAAGSPTSRRRCWRCSASSSRPR